MLPSSALTRLRIVSNAHEKERPYSNGNEERRAQEGKLGFLLFPLTRVTKGLQGHVFPAVSVSPSFNTPAIFHF